MYFKDRKDAGHRLPSALLKYKNAPHTLAIGALAGDIIWLDPDIVAATHPSPAYIDQIVAHEKQEAQRRLALFRQGKPSQNFTRQTILLIDDGIATGSTMRASIAWIKKSQSSRIVIAVPVAPPDTLASLKSEVDEIVCLYAPESFMAVGQFYDHFAQTEDAEVINILKKI